MPEAGFLKRGVAVKPEFQDWAGIELRQIDVSRGRSRRYLVAECRTLFGELALLISWGRIKRPPRIRIETFASEAEVEARMRALLARRRAHGYTAESAPSSGEYRLERGSAGRERAPASSELG